MRVLLSVLFILLFAGRSEARQLKVLNLNMWGIELPLPDWVMKSPSIDLLARVARLPGEVKKIDPDIIVFEEVWNVKRAEEIEQLLLPLGYKYHAARSVKWGWLIGGGNGLLIVSKLPLDAPEAIAFSHATRWSESFLICFKGVLKTRVEISNGTWIDLYATHLGATTFLLSPTVPQRYDPDNLEMQLAQAEEIATFVNRTHHERDLLFAADLNSHPFTYDDGHYTQNHSKVYDLMTLKLGLKDSAPDSQVFTYDTTKNHYANQSEFGKEPPGRIDYVFSKGSLRPVSTTLEFTENPLSDHYGLLATYELGDL